MKQLGYSIIEFSGKTLPAAMPVPVKTAAVINNDISVMVTVAIILILTLFLIESYFEIKRSFKSIISNLKSTKTADF